MGRNWLVAAVATTASIGWAGCGGSSPQSQQARAAVSNACLRLDKVGQAMEAHTPTAGSAIDQQLRLARSNIDRATVLDRNRWAGLDGWVRGFVASLEAGHAPTTDQVDGVTKGCSPFAPPSPPPSGGGPASSAEGQPSGG